MSTTNKILKYALERIASGDKESPKNADLPFCGFPYGFHEFKTLPEMPEDDCCIHCGRPRRKDD